MPSILPLHLADKAFGGTLVGTVMSASLWGMACIQVYSYYTHCSKDHPLLKYTIALLMILNTLHTVLVVHTVYYYLISQYGDPTAAVRVIWSDSAGNFVTEIMNVIIRILYARRIWWLSKGNKWIVGAILGFSIPTLAFAIAASALLYQMPDISQIATGDGIYKNFRRFVYVSFVFVTVSEILITCSMFYYLRKLRTNFQKTKTLVQVLIKYVIMTGLLAILVPLASQIIFYVNPLVTWSTMLYYPDGHLYMNSFLALLNARDALRSDNHISVNASVFTTLDRATESSVQYPRGVRDSVVVLQEINTFTNGSAEQISAKAKI